MNAHSLIIFFCQLAMGTWMLNNQSLAQNSSHPSENYPEIIQKLPEAFQAADAAAMSRFLHQLHEQITEPSGLDTTIGRRILDHLGVQLPKLDLTSQLRYLKVFEPIFWKENRSEDQAHFHHLIAKGYQRSAKIDSMSMHIDSMANYVELIQSPSILRVLLGYIQGRNAHLKGDFQASLNYLLNALTYLEKHFPSNIEQRKFLLNGIGIGYRRTSQQIKAIQHHHRTLQYLQANTTDTHWQANILNNLGLCYEDLAKYDSAAYYMLAAIAGYEQMAPRFTNQVATGYANLARVYNSSGQPELAMQYVQKSANLMHSTYGENHPDLLLTDAILAEIYFNDSKIIPALGSINLALQRLKSLGWSKKSPRGEYYLSDALATLADRVEIMTALFHEGEKISVLDSALAAADDFLTTVDFAYDNLKSQVSKEVFQKMHRRIFSIAIDNLHNKYLIDPDVQYVEEALNWSEKYKALELLFAARKDRIEQDPAFRNLATEYDRLQIELAKASHAGISDGTASPEFRDAQQKVYTWKEDIQQKFAPYYQILFHPPNLDLLQLQQNYLSADQSLISFHVSSRALFVIILNSNEVVFEQVALKRDLKESVAALRNAVYGYFTGGDRDEDYYQESAIEFLASARQLYQDVFEPIAAHVRQRVVIIPDQVLAYLPFDLLIDGRANSWHEFKSYNYLLKKHAISYAYSIPHWIEMRQQQPAANHRVLAFAPGYRDTKGVEDPDIITLRSSLRPLLHNTREVHALTGDWKTSIWTGAQGSKQNFLENAEEYGIIHLAMHAKANDQNGNHSYLAFSNMEGDPFKLYANEIYGLDLSTELLCLSACESGLGELQMGEGMISLARAFTFAGASSLVCTSWAVNDASTPIIMQHFYQYLRTGTLKDQALQRAKLDYINRVDDALAHPFYWAGFTAFGDMQAITGDSVASWWIYVAISLILLFALLIYQGKREKKA